ncbi:MAG: undecaprenyl-phosphate alpha-N-acetylglucosaminyl 1-phosphate transferase [Gammaproteobacteria bacterium]|nr:undecaprenyl-phosphate alpha-N-acetylglucosaminyl 1-phosphate transferase [Gammaproteobacteria bacterium]
MENLASYIVAFTTTCLFIWALQPVAEHIGLVDKPGGRKKHKGAVPLIGGIAMYIGLLTGLSIVDFPFAEIKGLIIAGGLLLAIGTIDDFVDLRPAMRFLAQITAALMIVFIDGVVLVDLGNLFGNSTFDLGPLSVIFSVIAIVGVINAVNMSDGMDGLAGGLAFVTLTVVGVAALVGSSPLLNVIPLFLAVLFGFLMFNMRSPWRKRAQIFMGNGGSMLLGLILVWFLVSAAQGEDRVISPVTALWLVALPLLDTVCIMLRRIIKGRSPFAPDREHFHHILLVAGYSPQASVWFMISIAMILAFVGGFSQKLHLSEPLMMTAFITMFALYFWGMSHAWRVMKVIRRTNTPTPQDNSHIFRN